MTLTDNGNGTASLAGTPAAGTAGSYPITITAANGVSPNAQQSFTLTVSGTTYALSGTLTAGATNPVGAAVWVYDAVTSAYVNGTLTGAGGAYSINLAPGTYKLWITGVTGYPDQAYGPDGTFANATVIDLTTGNQTVNISLIP